MSLTKLRDNFEKKLHDGEAVESQFLGILKRKDSTANKIAGNYKWADFNCAGKTYELKYDEMSDKTGNFAIEIRFKGKPSGLSTTTADYFVIADSEYFYQFDTFNLREFIKTNWHYLKDSIKFGGDENLSQLILVNKDDLLNYLNHEQIQRE